MVFDIYIIDYRQTLNSGGRSVCASVGGERLPAIAGVAQCGSSISLDCMCIYIYVA